MDRFDFPLVPRTILPNEAFRRMKKKGVSAVVCRIGEDYYLLEAGTAFLSWKLYANKWDPAQHGILLHRSDVASKDPERIGILQFEVARESTVTLYSKHETWMARYRTGPAACYCTVCGSAGKPKRCDVCGNESILCAK